MTEVSVYFTLSRYRVYSGLGGDPRPVHEVRPLRAGGHEAEQDGSCGAELLQAAGSRRPPGYAAETLAPGDKQLPLHVHGNCRSAQNFIFCILNTIFRLNISFHFIFLFSFYVYI